jgi:hypothetical protein
MVETMVGGFRVIGHRKFILRLITDKPGIRIGEIKMEFGRTRRQITWRRLIYHISVLHFLGLIIIHTEDRNELLELITSYCSVDFRRVKRPTSGKIELIKRIALFPKES